MTRQEFIQKYPNYEFKYDQFSIYEGSNHICTFDPDRYITHLSVNLNDISVLMDLVYLYLTIMQEYHNLTDFETMQLLWNPVRKVDSER